VFEQIACRTKFVFVWEILRIFVSIIVTYKNYSFPEKKIPIFWPDAIPGFSNLIFSARGVNFLTVLWNRTVLIYCGSGSDFGKVLVPVPDPDNISQFSNSNKNCTK
jgi:hypothetical protein